IQGDAQRPRLLVIDQQLVLRFVIQTIRADRLQHGTLSRHPQELVARPHQGLMPEAGTVLQVEVEAGGVAELHDRGRRESEHLSITEIGEVLLGALGQREDALLRVRTLAPWLEPDERQRRVLAAAGKVEAGYG